MWLKIHINANNIKKKSGFSVIIYLKVGCAVCLHKLCGKCHLMKACRHNLNLFRKFSCTKKIWAVEFLVFEAPVFMRVVFQFKLWFSFFLDFLRVGISVPTVEVRFEHLNVETEAYVGSRAMPTFFNYCVNTIEVPTCKHKLLAFIKLVLLSLLISLLNFLILLISLLNLYQCVYVFEGFVELSEYPC